MSNSSLNDLLAELRQTYLAALPARADLIEKLMNEGSLDNVETEFHKLKGTGKTYGLPEVTAIGEVTERLIEKGPATAAIAVPIALNVLRRVPRAHADGQSLDLTTDTDYLRLTALALEEQNK